MGKLYTPNITSGLGFSYDFTIDQPFDTREVVSTFNDLISLNTWKKGNDYVHYKGMKVSCADSGKIYVYIGESKSSTDVVNSNKWIASGSGSGGDGGIPVLTQSMYENLNSKP